MKIRLESLALQCRKSRELIEFTTQITYFHGKISAGKSTIARLVDFCFGGSLEKTPAIRQELVSASLALNLGDNQVVLDRDVSSGSVNVTWRNSSGEAASVLAPIDADDSRPAIWGDTVYNLSDLIFHLCGVRPMKVRRSKTDQNSKLVRLSFRDLMWYCYLDQDHLDSSFYRLEQEYKKLKSRDVMRFLVGYYSDEITNIEIQIEEARQSRLAKIEAIKNVREFARRFDVGTELELSAEISRISESYESDNARMANLRATYQAETHFADQLRAKLRDLSNRLQKEAQIEKDLDIRITEQAGLRSELISTKFKLMREHSARIILANVSFESCPECGLEIKRQETSPVDSCRLCCQKTPPDVIKTDGQSSALDIDSRVAELGSSIELHKRALKKQHKLLQKLVLEKSDLDAQLSKELEAYDSKFLAAFRELEGRIAANKEKISSLERLGKIFDGLRELEDEANKLEIDERSLRKELSLEKSKLKGADFLISEIEKEYHAALLAVGVPGVMASDEVKINRVTWIPEILPAGQEGLGWNFFEAGSGGKKTLLNVCYALAIHSVAERNGLPLPTFLIVDSPMKNIGTEVNRDLFVAFYNYLYTLAADRMKRTQFIVIDQEYIDPPQDGPNVRSRFMSNDPDSEAPPLISYYKGP